MPTSTAELQREKAHRLIRRVSTDPVWDRARKHCGGLYLLRVALEEGCVLPIEADLFLIEGEYNPPEDKVRNWLIGRGTPTERARRLGVRVVQGGGQRRAHLATESSRRLRRLQPPVAKKLDPLERVHPKYYEDTMELVAGRLLLDMGELKPDDLADLTHWFASRLP